MYDDVSSSLNSVTMDRRDANPPKKNAIQFFNNLLRAQLGNSPSLQRLGAPTEWVDLIFKQSNIFYGYDELMWGAFVVCVYHDSQDSQLSCILIDKTGVNHFSPVDVTRESQYYPAIENLVPAHKDSESRQCIAVTFLQRFAQLSEQDVRRLHPDTFKFDYDPTHAGDLASACTQVEGEDKLVNVGKKLLSLGFFQERLVTSTLLDVVYEYNDIFSESNNKLVFHLGQQLEQLFNPLTEYSPEQTEHTYKPPNGEIATEDDDALIKAISRELLELQGNFTLNLVEFLQKFVIVLRVRVLNGEIEGLSTVKLNRLFPPTIDEVTRINCIFLDSLKSATPFGSLEVLRACSVTIPYFYKAYTRHEAATKNFNKDIKLFLKTFTDQMPLPEVFSEMKIDSLIKGPQEKLMKIKLILDRLYASKKWKPENEEEAKKCYDNVIEIIDSFGRLKGPLSSYSSRVFTPSGKILTELAKGWPAELQYKWLKRRVVGVFDMTDPKDTINEKLLVIFSDYLVFLDVVEDRNDYESAKFNKPFISDILMNSLVNEVPLPPKMPLLKVDRYCYIDEVVVTLFGDNCVRFDAFRDVDSFAVALRVKRKSLSAYTIVDLITKAKILEKDTAFHLFKAVHDDITIYSTAHEKEVYKNETIKSKFALFLNMDPTEQAIIQHKLHVAMFVKIVSGVLDAELVQLDILTSDGGFRSIRIAIEELIPVILRQLSFEIPICFSSIYSPFLSLLLVANESIIKEFGYFNLTNNPKSKALDKDPGKEESRPPSSSVAKEPKYRSQHHPEKSYSTITTFRSNISDTKTVNKRQSEDKFDFEEIEQPQESQTKSLELRKKDIIKPFPQRPISTLSTNQEPQPSSGTFERHQKRRSISDVFKSIFSSKKKTISAAKDKTKKKNEKISKESRKFFPSNNNSKSNGGKRTSFLQGKYSSSTRAERSSSNESFPNEPLTPIEPPNMGNKPVEGARQLPPIPKQFNANSIEANDKRLSTNSDISKHSKATSTTNSKYSGMHRTSQVPETMKQKVDQPRKSTPFEVKLLPKESIDGKSKGGDQKLEQSNKKGVSEFPQSNPDEHRKNNQSMEFKTNSPDNSQLSEAQEGAAVEGLEEKPSRESQVFNDDLFGDVIPDPRKGPSSSHFNGSDIVQLNQGNSVSRTNLQAAGDLNSSISPFDNNKSENSKDELKPQGGSQQKENSSDVANIESIHPTVKLQDKLLQKKPVNPKIQNLKKSKIHFERSSSFVELFQGMRLVLDESDAKYNWKRLPSEYSLRDTLPVNIVKETAQQSQPQHAFKSIAFAGMKVPQYPRSESPVYPAQVNPESARSFNQGTMQLKQIGDTNQNFVQQSGKKTLNVNEQKQKSDAAQNVVRDKKVGFISPKIPAQSSVPEVEYEDMRRQSVKNAHRNAFVSPGNPNLSAADNNDILEKEQEEKRRDVANEQFENALLENSALSSPSEHARQSNSERPARKKIPTFKVVDHSPTRIVQRISPDRTTSPYDIPSDISISSDLDEQTNKRLFELKFPSKEDFNNDGSSSMKNPPKLPIPNATTQAVGYTPETSIPSALHNDNSSTSPENSPSSGKVLSREDGGLLGDLDFSSFNVTFDNFSKDRDVSQRSINHGLSNILENQGPLTFVEEQPRVEEPVVYRLPRSNENSAKKFHLNKSSNARQTQNDDDPIWISPSKLDYYDINKFNEPSFKNEKGTIRTTTTEGMHKILAENPTSANELSYTYLASFIDDVDNQSLNTSDKPIRLTFRE